MLKTIKTTKKVDFFELVKGVQTGIYKHGDYRVVGRNEGSVWVDLGGFVLEEPDNKILFTDLFKVEVEEPITEDTVFDDLIEVTENGRILTYLSSSIKEISDSGSKAFFIYKNDEFIKVWERDEE